MINEKNRQHESGFAALIIAFTLVTVLSLLTLGFSQLIRNESKQALNRQLSSQAYYAAESGVNDAVEAINHGYAVSKTFCGPDLTSTTGAKYLSNNNVTTSATNPTRTQWSCVLIDKRPTSVDYSSIDTVNPTIFTATAVDAAGVEVPIVSITVAWQDADPNNINFRPTSGAVNNAFPLASLPTPPPSPAPSKWAAPGVLRLAFTPLNVITRVGLAKSTYTAFLYPNNATAPGITTTAYTDDQTQTGKIIDGNCATINKTIYERYCAVTFNTIASPYPATGIPAGTKLFFNLRSVYSKTSAHIIINGGNARLLGAQTMIDSTGKSQDVLKRIQVRVPTDARYIHPGFSLESADGICKQLSVYPNFASGCGYTTP